MGSRNAPPWRISFNALQNEWKSILRYAWTASVAQERVICHRSRAKKTTNCTVAMIHTIFPGLHSLPKAVIEQMMISSRQDVSCHWGGPRWMLWL